MSSLQKIVVLCIVGGVILIGGFFVLNSYNEKQVDEERLQTLQSDPIYSIRYPNATELRRWERGSRGFVGGVEKLPTIGYYAGTNDSDDKIFSFFIDKATSNGWSILREPEQITMVERMSVVFHKDNVGWLFVRTFEPERLNQLLRGEKFPTNYAGIFQVTLQAKELEP